MDLVKEGKTIYSAVTIKFRFIEDIFSSTPLKKKGRDPILGYAIADDYNRTGKCSVEIAQENYMELQLTWAMRKNNPYTDYINKGYMLKSIGSCNTLVHKHFIDFISINK